MRGAVNSCNVMSESYVDAHSSYRARDSVRLFAAKTRSKSDCLSVDAMVARLSLGRWEIVRVASIEKLSRARSNTRRSQLIDTVIFKPPWTCTG